MESLLSSANFIVFSTDSIVEASPCINQHVSNYPASRKILLLWLQYAATGLLVKSLARPGRKQAWKHVRDKRDFNNIETRAVIKFFFSFFFLQGKALKEIHTILTETLACFLLVRLRTYQHPCTITCMCYIQFNTTVVPFDTSPWLEHCFQAQSNIVCYGYMRRESLQFIKYTLVYNWWQIRKTAIVAEISSTAIYSVLSVCVTLFMPWTRAIWRYTAVQRYLLRICDAASRQTLHTIRISHTGLPTLKQRSSENSKQYSIQWTWSKEICNST